MSTQDPIADGVALFDFEQWQSAEGGIGAGVNVGRLETLTQQAFEEGYAAGFAQGNRDGLAAAATEVAKLTATLSAALEHLQAPLTDLDAEVVESLAALAGTIARQLVRRELKTDPQVVLAAVREAAGVLPVAAREVRLYLNPEDMVIVREAMGTDMVEGMWRLCEDPVLERGGCRLESDASRIDATVDARLNAIISDVMGGEREQD